MLQIAAAAEPVIGGLARAWSRIRDALLALLFPDDVCCLCCGRALGNAHEDGVCPRCCRALEEMEAREAQRVETEPLPEEIDAVFAAYPYRDQAKALILRMKYEHVRAAAVPLGRAMAMLPGGEADVLVPVPTTRRRLRQRGFNQAALLCEVIARETGMPMEEALTRTKEREAQTHLRAQQRRKNLVGTMCATRLLSGKRIILVDDVYTTGATAREAARALKAAGASSVSVFAAARTVFTSGQSNGR